MTNTKTIFSSPTIFTNFIKFFYNEFPITYPCLNRGTDPYIEYQKSFLIPK